MTRSRVVTAAALLALGLGALLVVFAVDVLRWERSLAEQDARFVAVPGRAQFASPDAVLPFGLAERVLAARDDLAFRRQLERFVRVRPGVVVTEPERFGRLRSEAQLGLAALSRADPDPRRRSRVTNMLGVLALDPQFAPRDAAEVEYVVRRAVESFRVAVETDPAHADAKLNLEQALRIPPGAVVPGERPSGARQSGELAGLGRPGSGY